MSDNTADHTSIDHLDPRHDDDVALIVRYLGGSLSHAEAIRVTRRLEEDRAFAQLAAPLMESWHAPPQTDEELESGLADIRRRAVVHRAGWVDALAVDDATDSHGRGPAPVRTADPEVAYAPVAYTPLASIPVASTPVAFTPPRPRWRLRRWHPVAVVLAVYLFGGGVRRVMVGRSPVDRQDIANIVAAFDAGRRGDEFVLPDGTRVVATVGAVLDSAGFTLAHRLVRLTGGATFHVTRDTHSAFAVETANALVTAAGTVFVVRSDTTNGTPRTTVELKSGTVAVRSRTAAGRELTLQAGQSASVVGGGRR
ncbi:MAG: hypothetical protein NVS9B3_16120 [Gemmatimonadaceae bacterium]